MAALVCTGLGLAVLAAAMTFLMAGMLSSSREQVPPVLAGLGCATAGFGALRVAERVLAEKLGQHYVQQIRKRLLRRALSSDSSTSMGITIARTTNDLSSVRNWIVLGLAPVVVAVPAILGTCVAIWILSPPLAVAALGPLLLLAAALALLAGPALARAREVRRRRGRLAAQIADTVAAAATIQAAGGADREVGRIGSLADRMVAAAVKQAAITGCLRAAAAVAAAVGLVSVAGTGALLGIDNVTIAAALTAAGMMSAPVSDTGRIVEYRQKYLAARQILAPLLSRAPGGAVSHPPALAGAVPEEGSVRISELRLNGGPVAPELHILPGQRVVIQADPDLAAEACRTLLGLSQGSRPSILVGRSDILALPPGQRRAMVGYAAGGAVLERGSIARAVRYRRPDLPASVTVPSLAGVGLLERVRALPAAERTRLRAGGQPLTRSERARLQLARAVLGDPPLLVLEHIDRDLGAHGCAAARTLLASYPGVVILAAENPAALVSGYVVWDLGPGASTTAAGPPAPAQILDEG